MTTKRKDEIAQLRDPIRNVDHAHRLLSPFHKMIPATLLIPPKRQW